MKSIIFDTIVTYSSKVSWHDYTVMCRTFKSASRPARSSVDEECSITPQHRPTSTHHEQASQRCSDHRTNDTRSTAASVTETVNVQITLPATLSRSNIASVGAGMSHSNEQFTSCYAMPDRFYSCALRQTFLLSYTAWLADRRCSPHRDRLLTLSPVTLAQSCQPWAIHICTIMSNNPWDLWNILTILTSRTKRAPNWLFRIQLAA